MLQIYTFYIYDRRGTRMFYHEWKREHNPDPEGDPKLMFGLLFSLKLLVQKLTPGAAPANDAAAGVPPGNVTSFSTSDYTLHQFETATGLRFVLISGKCKDQILKDVQAALRHVYSDLYTNIVVKNPLHTPGAKITNPHFAKQLDRYMVGVAKRFA